MKKIILSLVCGIVVLGLTVGCNKKEEITNNELTKEEIANIEEQYYNSELVLNINSYSRISDKGLVIITNFENSEALSNKIFEFINSKGKIQKAVSLSVESMNSTTSILLQSINEEDIKFSSILFKNKKYKGANILFTGTKEEMKSITKYLDQNRVINIKSNNNTSVAEIVSYFIDYVNDSFNTLNLSVIFEENITLDDLVFIEGYSLQGYINNYIE